MLARAARTVPQQFNSSWKRSFHVSAVAEAKLNVEGLADKVNLSGQNVLVRVDLNVPLAKVGWMAMGVLGFCHYSRSLSHTLVVSPCSPNFLLAMTGRCYCH